MSHQLVSEHFKLPSPVEKHTFSIGGINQSFFVKRDDLIHTLVSGNKWRKLRYNIEFMINHGMKGLVTCGGPWSNHLFATAVCAEIFNCRTTGFVRGDYHKQESYVLKMCKEFGMELIFLTNREFDELMLEPRELLNKNKLYDHFWIPLGGSNDLGKRGCHEIVQEVIESGIKPDLWCIPAGTTTTAAGILEEIDYECDMYIFPAIGKEKQQKEFDQLFKIDNDVKLHIWDSPRLRFGKADKSLIDLLQKVQLDTGILFDPLYNGKMMESILEGDYDSFSNFKTPLLLHTGGLSGWRGISSHI